MRALILVASADKKDVSSTAGMQQTVATSALFQHRAEVIVPRRMKAMEKAIQDRDFEQFATLTTKDSNNFHATCSDTDPPIFYMNDTSRAAVRMVEAINATTVDEASGSARTLCAYTFDAGPNAVVYYLAVDEQKVAGAFKALLGDKTGWEGKRGQAVTVGQVPPETEVVGEILKKGVSRVILTAIDVQRRAVGPATALRPFLMHSERKPTLHLAATAPLNCLERPASLSASHLSKQRQNSVIYRWMPFANPCFSPGKAARTFLTLAFCFTGGEPETCIDHLVTQMYGVGAPDLCDTTSTAEVFEQ
ncbi:hypothetical protein KC347_g131 [Hortaea werneckii]|nr:hypothetical protein KC347_g131 [Hortaea werneckii]